MPTSIFTEDDIQPGEIYEDSGYHPCLCVGVMEGSIWGISLVDGSHPRTTSIEMSAPMKLTLQEAWQWKFCGPADGEIDPKRAWWGKGNCGAPFFDERHIGKKLDGI